ncbi:MAG TPA: FAD-binding oxidoreductase [Nitriliruptoraceae bacterium]|nr:FAD-binding oxidoreductase [Nitriliruptoraceae bacterium]
MSSAPAPRTPALRCVVAGAGVLGITTAWRLAQAGADVVLVDGGASLGLAASRATFAHVNASYAGYWDYMELRRAGVEGYHRLRREPDGAPWWHDTGFVAVHRPGADVEALDRHLVRLREAGYPVEPLDSAPDTVEPALRVDDAVRTLVFPSEGWVEMPSMLLDLQSRARQLGVRVRAADPVVGIEPAGDDVAVRLRSDETLVCDRLVVCCGRWTDDVLASAGIEGSLVADDTALGTPVPGLLVATGEVDGSVGRVVAVDDVNLRPMGDGRTMVWSGVADHQLQERGGAQAPPAVIDRLATELVRTAARHVPALDRTGAEEAIVTQRALPTDGLPVVGPVDGADGVHVALAHAAVTLAPALAESLVEEVVHERPDPRLARFRPDRFTDAGQTPDEDGPA